MELKELKDKKILILGFGREGRDTFLFLRKLFPRKVIGIADAKPGLAKSRLTKGYFGKDYLKAVKDYDVIIKSPGIPFKILPKSALKKIATQTDIFFAKCPGRIIGVTGTKGKSTTSSLIYSILKAGGFKVHLIGNIGEPVLSYIQKAGKDDIFVYELSSHQLYNLKRGPYVAVLLNIYPEHLDYYRNFKEYAASKANITLHQSKNDYFVYNSKDKNVLKIAKKTKAIKIPIQGEYYELDRNAARAVARIFKTPEKTISKAISKFKGLAHRLEFVGEFKGIAFYNDALATIPEATIAAIKTLGNKVETIMLGGFDRKIDFKNLAREVLKSKIKTVILFPTTGEKIWKDILVLSKRNKVPKHFSVDKAMKVKLSSSPSPNKNGAQYMKEAVRLAYKHTSKGQICLLSTASSSFSIFKDYKEKGDLFKKYVKRLVPKK